MSNIFVETLGCPKNQEDSEKIAGLLELAGHRIVQDPDESDVIILNTCGFIEDAKRESIETFFDFVPYKDKGTKLIVTGCLTQRYPEEIKSELPEADAIFGVNDYEKLPGVLSELLEDENVDRAERMLFASSASKNLEAPRVALSPRFSSYLKIAEGCSNNCAYCIIPRIRGPYRSQPIEQILDQSKKLAEEGCKELILIAQDLTWYGKDIYGQYVLPEVLRKLLAEDSLKSIEWFRLLYCYQERVTDELIELMAKEKRILPYIDIPLQHVNGEVLKNMRRLSTPEGIRKTISDLRSAMPGMVIRTTFITGLPGETEEAFQELYDFVRETRFNRLGVFAYSPEDGTDAILMPNQVEKEVAEERRDAIMALQQQISLEKNMELIGTTQDVIVEEIEEDKNPEKFVYVGRAMGDAPEIDGSVIFSAPVVAAGNPYDTIGKIVKVRITDAMDYDLVGEMV